jgi:diguanylate cyclase (GGDEF)-like protein
MRFSFLVCCGLIAAEALALSLAHRSVAAGWMVDFFFLILTRAMLTAACAWRATKAVSLRTHWILLGSEMLLQVIALSIQSWIYYRSVILHGSVSLAADYADLILSLSGVPLIILLTIPSSGKSSSREFFWIYTVQAILWGYIEYLKLFGVIPFTQAELHPEPAKIQILLSLTTGAVTIVVAFLRFISATTVDERSFFRFFTIYLVVINVLIELHDIVAGEFTTASYYELLGTIPILVALLLVLALPGETLEAAIPRPPGRIAEVLNIAAPSLLTLMLMGAGVDAMRRFFNFGSGVVAVAFTLYLVRSVIIQRNLERSERSLKEARDKLEAISLTDALTGVANRRCFDDVLVAEWNRAVRTRDTLSLLMLDIDHFKNLNDTQGHQAGDECIVMVARAISDCLPRSGDMPARYGGEEFCVILPSTDSEGARIVATRMREAVHGLAIPNETPAGLHVSISVGIATCYFPSDLTAHQLLEAADKALYRAKKNGRNRVEAVLSSVLL